MRLSIRNLEELLEPQSVAVFGASERPGSLGRVIMDSIREGGFAGRVYPVNPKYGRICGARCYAGISEVPGVPDLAVIATPPATVPGIIAELGAKGVPAAIVLTAGIGPKDGLRQKMLDAAQPSLLRILGPNTLGFVSPRAKLNASFAHIGAESGGLALISQSGAIATTLIDWAAAQSIGFSAIFSLGDMADVDAGDCIDLMARDPMTKAILLYLETIPQPRKFISAARAASRLKPVIVLKPGRHESAAKAAATHTGALSGSDEAVSALLRRSGVIRVRDLDELFLAAEAAVRFPPQAECRVGLVTNGGGAGVLAADQLADEAVALAELGDATIARLDAALPATWSHGNPVDIIGDAPPERYAAAVAAVADDLNVEVLMVMNCPTAMSTSEGAADAVARLAEKGRIGGKPVFACWLGEATARAARAKLEAAGIASFETPARTSRAVGFLGAWSRSDRLLSRIPHYHPGRTEDDIEAARKILEAAALENRTMLTEPEAKAVITAYGIETTECRTAGSAEDAEKIAGEMLAHHERLVLKLLSRDISHKSDVGGVALDIKTAAEAGERAQNMLEKAGSLRPDARLDGLVLQPMIRRPGAHELIAGVSRDPQLGPVITFGAGGTAVEVIKDAAIALPPIDDVLAGDLIDQTRISRLLAGYRDRPPANREAIVSVLLATSRLVVDFPAISGIDINPLLADETGVIALDARIEIDPARVAEAGPNPDLPIKPYPAQWHRDITLRGGQRLTIRPILPADAGGYADFLARTSDSDIRARLFVAKRQFTADELRRLTQLDYDREMAFVAIEPESSGLAGIARLAADPNGEHAEYGIIVRGDRQGEGLGWALLEHLVTYARAEGMKTLFGNVLAENEPMLKMCREFGFDLDHNAQEPGAVRVTLSL